MQISPKYQTNCQTNFGRGKELVIPVKELKACVEQRMKLSEMAEKFQTSKSNICKKIQDFNITPQREARHAYTKEKLKELLSRNLSLDEISENMGVCKQKVWGMLGRFKLFPIDVNTTQRREHLKSIKQMLKNGKTVNEISSLLKIPPSAVRSYINLYDVSIAKAIEKNSDTFTKSIQY